MERRPVRPKAAARSSLPQRLGQADMDQLSAQALGFLGSDGERLGRFLDATGLSPQSLRAAAAQDGFGASLIEYLASDEALYLGFAEAHGYAPADLDAIRVKLSGIAGGP